MKLYYGTTMTALARGRAFRNPEFFQLADPRATDVIIVGDYPLIENTYQAMGVPVRVVATDNWTELNQRSPDSFAEAVQASVQQPITEPARAAPVEAQRVQPSRPAGIDIPADWQQMPWADLRRLAASVSGMIIINKTDAIAAIRRAIGDDGEVDGSARTRS